MIFMIILGGFMKKNLFFILIILLLVIVGCADDEGFTERILNGGVSDIDVTTENGKYTDKIVLSWLSQKNVTEYQIERSQKNIDGTFDYQVIGTLDASGSPITSTAGSSSTSVSTSISSRSISTTLPDTSVSTGQKYKTVFLKTTRDINYVNSKIALWRTLKLGVKIGDTIDVVIGFKGKIAHYTRDQVVTKIHDAIKGKLVNADDVIITPVNEDGKETFQITSKIGSIRFTNENDCTDLWIKYAALRQFFDGSSKSKGDYIEVIAEENEDTGGGDTGGGDTGGGDTGGGDTGGGDTGGGDTGGGDIYITYEDKVNIAQGTDYYYKITAYNSSRNAVGKCYEVVGRARTDLAPSAPQNTLATKGNDDLVITWDPGTKPGNYFKVFVSRKETGPFSVIEENTPNTSVIFTGAKPGPYFVKVAAVNDYGESNHSNVDFGFRAITHRELYYEINRTIVLSQIKTNHMFRSGTSKLGGESFPGEKGGTMAYDAHMKGFGAEIFFDYNDYCDGYLILTGRNKTIANMSANGDLTGTINVSGLYEGSIRFAIKITSEKASGGSYYITMNGTEVQITLSSVGDAEQLPGSQPNPLPNYDMKYPNW